MPTSITRRAALLGAAASSAAVALPVLAGAPWRPSAPAEGLCIIQLAGRLLLIDTGDVPVDELRQGERTVTPSAGAEYVFARYTGALGVAGLAEGTLDPRMKAARVGWLKVADGLHEQVTVLGKVV